MVLVASGLKLLGVDTVTLGWLLLLAPLGWAAQRHAYGLPLAGQERKALVDAGADHLKAEPSKPQTLRLRQRQTSPDGPDCPLRQLCCDAGCAAKEVHVCEDQNADRSGSRFPLSRRRLLQSAGLLAASGLTAGGAVLRHEWGAGSGPDADLPASQSMAMHVHTSFSEQSGSMSGHLAAAEKYGVDVVWWTDHDFRMSGHGYREAVHFTSLIDEAPEPGQGTAWEWRQVTKGPLSTGSTGGIVAQPASPKDPVAAGSLHVVAESTGKAPASLGFFADATKAGRTYHGNMFGQTLILEVFPDVTGDDGYLELLVASSFHPAGGGRPEGTYALSYRFGGVDAAGVRRSQGLIGVISLPFVPRQWNTVTLRPSDDIAALWPDLDARDFALFGMTLNAVSSNRTLAGGYFDYLRMTRVNTGNLALQVQTDIAAGYVRRYPRVTQRQGLEVSWLYPHLNWFGGRIALPDYTSLLAEHPPERILQDVLIPRIATQGGLCSYNHPFGPDSLPLLPAVQQDELLAKAAARILPTRALGATILEVGYDTRGGVDLAHHLGLWDVCSRNGVFLTGNGTTDDHFSTRWVGGDNDWVTTVWATDTSEPALLSALRSGRAWCSSLSRYRGSLDLLVDHSVPMGAVSVSGLTRRTLDVIATQLPIGAKVQVLQGQVDYAGVSAPTPNTTVVASYPARALQKGRVALSLDTKRSSFCRVEVLDLTGRVISASNPVWLLRERPPAGSPQHRAA